jgi:hypothetical protein
MSFRDQLGYPVAPASDPSVAVGAEAKRGITRGARADSTIHGASCTETAGDVRMHTLCSAFPVAHRHF